MALIKVSCLVILLAFGVVRSEDLEGDLETAETAFLGKKILLLKGLGLGGVLLASQNSGSSGLGGLGGFGALTSKFSGLGGGNTVSADYAPPPPPPPPAQAYNYAPSYAPSYAPAPVVPQTYASYSTNYVAAPAPVPISAPPPPPPVAYSPPAPVPVSYDAPQVSTGYSGNLQLVGILTPVQSIQAPAPISYGSQVSTGYYGAPAAPVSSGQPCEN